MRIRLKTTPTRARRAIANGENIFLENYTAEKPRAVVPRLNPAALAEVVHPVAFRAQSADEIGKATPARFKGISALSAQGRVVTPNGACRIADLVAGDLVLTRDNGFRPLLWTMPVARGAQAPCVIEIAQGALGGGKPTAALQMSGRQRVLLTGQEIHTRFGAQEVLVRAADLLHVDGVRQITQEIEMVALLFGSHEVLRVNDSWLDTLQPDRETRAHLTDRQEAELLQLVPHLKDLPIERSYPAARKVLNSAFARQVEL